MESETPKSRGGCFRIGCIAGLVLLLVLIIGGLVGMRYAKKMFNDFTDSKPAPLPPPRISRAEIDQVEQRIEEFRQAVRTDRATPPLELTADEINGLIAYDPDFRGLKGKLYVRLAGDKLEGELSLPMEAVGLPLFKGRYLNGMGTFGLSLRNGRIDLRTLSFVVKGKSVPEVYMQQIRKQNLADSINDDPRARAAFEKLQDIKVREGKLFVIPKKAAAN